MTFLGALFRAALSGLYWFCVLALLYATIAGDRNPSAPPPGVLAHVAPLLVVASGVLVHAGIHWAWGRRR